MNVKDQLPLLQWAEESRMSITHFLEYLEKIGYHEPYTIVTIADLIKTFMELKYPGTFLVWALPKITGLHFDTKEDIWKELWPSGGKK